MIKKRVLSNITNIGTASRNKIHLNIDDKKFIECRDLNDSMCITMYYDHALDVIEYNKELETKRSVHPEYIKTQPDITWKMRSTLIDWIIDAHWRLNLTPETLFITVNILDRFLAQRVVSLSKLQSLGITALFIAAKFEEVAPPSIENFVSLTESKLEIDDIIKYERYFLHVLEYNLDVPPTLTFLRRCSKTNNYNTKTRTVARYLLEITLIYNVFLKYSYSIRATACFSLASKILQNKYSTNVLEHYIGYTDNHINECIKDILITISTPIEYENIQKKYSTTKFMKVSEFIKDYSEKHKTTLQKLKNII